MYAVRERDGGIGRQVDVKRASGVSDLESRQVG